MNLNSCEVRRLNIGRFLIHAVFLLLGTASVSFDHLFVRLRCVWAFICFALVLAAHFRSAVHSVVTVCVCRGHLSQRLKTPIN